ncbi:Arm DNA-binding domain-containing protein [Tetragenococcus halophilus]|uniref:Arm DNA-binding domain-containing protein n=1 Tax=Tetragenococcus halophilus TaxID=51669 RepID=UPI001F32022E|nr:Arm DNA-binding domain-containing protein [Tetragenococcus halophilus]MCF1684270.1 Arm DNA-binding domain-containing protein [Tetragenococcus halophilus]
MFNTYLGINSKTGKPKRTTRRGFKSIKKAKLALARLELGEDEATLKNQMQKKYITFKDVYEMWLPIYKAKVENSTLNLTENYFFYYILPDLDDRLIIGITYNDCHQSILRWSKHTSKFRAIRGYAQQVFKYARKNGWMNGDPFEDIETPVTQPPKKKETDKFYTKEEFNAFLPWANQNLFYGDFAAFRVIAYAGLRLGELRALTWEDVNFNEMSLDVNKAIKRNEVLGAPKNKSSFRKISLDLETISILKNGNLNKKNTL